MVSFLKDADSKDKFSWWDIIILLVLVGLGVGFYWYSGYIKRQSVAAFDAAQEIFDAHDYKQALKTYESMHSLAWMNDSLDSIRYERVTYLSEVKELEENSYLRVRSALQQADTTTAREAIADLQIIYFLDDERKTEIDSWKTLIH
jgi:hypothetical protein